MADQIAPARPGPVRLARKGEARPAMRPVNDNAAAAAPALIDAAIALAGGRRAAVTLRLDPARHMRLRLACALGGRSAQAIMSEALDAYFETIPDIERAVADSGEHAATTGRGTER